MPPCTPRTPCVYAVRPELIRMTHGADAAVDHIFRRKSGILQQLYANALQVHMEFRTFLHDERMHLCTEQLFHRFRHIRIVSKHSCRMDGPSTATRLSRLVPSCSAMTSTVLGRMPAAMPRQPE